MTLQKKKTEGEGRTIKRKVSNAHARKGKNSSVLCRDPIAEARPREPRDPVSVLLFHAPHHPMTMTSRTRDVSVVFFLQASCAVHENPLENEQWEKQKQVQV